MKLFYFENLRMRNPKQNLKQNVSSSRLKRLLNDIKLKPAPQLWIGDGERMARCIIFIEIILAKHEGHPTSVTQTNYKQFESLELRMRKTNEKNIPTYHFLNKI